ncbi:porin [Paraburkholderia fungorum]|nr:porin [Paraburkholderia fungorum]
MNSKRYIMGASLAATCIAANAQSAVTIYGIIDNTLQYTRHAGTANTQFKLQSGQFSASQWGLRGTEDLGGGNQAVFNLQNGFNANTGAMSGGLMFGRRAYVGLSNKIYGTVTAGRQIDTLQDLVLPVQGNYYMEYFSAPGDIDNADGTIRVSNAIKWTSPTWNGFTMALMYGVGGTAGSVASGQAYNGAVNYKSGALTVAGGYSHSDYGNASLTTRGTSAAQGIYSTAVNAAYTTAKAVNIVRAGSTYMLGPVTFGGYYSYSEYIPDGSSAFRNAERFNNVSLFGYWKIAPDMFFEAGYDFMKSHGDSSATYHQVTIASDYLLSKRTDVYASASYGHATGQNGQGTAKAVIADTYASAGTASQQIVMLGIRHRF